jgi:hypothetical protein
MKNAKLELVGLCGINCSKCDVYLACISNDKKKLEQIANEASFMTKERITIEDIWCLGCQNPKSKHREYLKIECILHKCATEKNVINCGHCAFYPCIKIQTHYKDFSMHPERAIDKMERKMKSLGGDCSNIDLWLKKTNKF